MHLFLVVLLAISAISQSQPPAPRPAKSGQPEQGQAATEKQKAPDNHQPPQDSPPALQQPSTEVTIWNESEATAKSKHEPATDRWSRIFGGAVALFTLALAILAYLQWQVMGQQREAMERQAGSIHQQWERMGDQLFTAKRSAKAARKAANAAKRNAKALVNAERAWITAELTLSRSIPVGQVVSADGVMVSVDICLKCRNDGATPAWITDAHIHLRNFVDVPPIPDFSEKFRDYVVPEAEPIAPGRHWEIGWELECDGPRVAKKTLLVYGFVKYRDVFSPERETRFAYYIRGDREMLRLPGDKYWEYNKYT